VLTYGGYALFNVQKMRIYFNYYDSEKDLSSTAILVATNAVFKLTSVWTGSEAHKTCSTT